MVQIQPRKPVLDHADYIARTRQHELDHTDHTDQEHIFHEISRSPSGNRLFVRGVAYSQARSGFCFRLRGNTFLGHIPRL